ncbi:MAG: hypothetical protein GY940_20670 [bacterium]|nr:hypothetical protein [bacterium]
MENQVSFTVSQDGVFTTVTDEEEKISVLTNSLDFFLGSVFMLRDNESYRLVVMHNERVLIDEPYKTAKGAKIAFYRFCRYRVWKEGVKPRWTPFYNPDVESIEDVTREERLKPFH